MVDGRDRDRDCGRGPCWIQALVLGLLAAASVAQYDLREQPIVGDRAYFVYLAQAVLRGDAIYSLSFFGYPPLAPLISAAAMGLGAFFDLPSHLAPRLLAVPLFASSAMLAFAVARVATGRAWAGAVAALFLMGMSRLAEVTAANLEPKLLVVFFTLLTQRALQQRRWMLAAAASVLGAGCWHPAGLVCLCVVAVVMYAEWPRPARPLLRDCALGAALGAFPSLLYLGVSGGAWDFWQRAVVILAQLRLPEAGASPLRWLVSIQRDFATEQLFFAAALAGLVWFGVDALRARARGLAAACFEPRFAAAAPLALAWIAFTSVEFTGWPDILPIIPVVALFGAWFAHRVADLGLRLPWPESTSGSMSESMSESRDALLFGRIGRNECAVALVLVGTALYGGLDAFLYAPVTTLSQQRTEVAAIIEGAEGRGPVFALNAEEVYIFDARAAPAPPLRLNVSFARFAHVFDPEGCDGLRKRYAALGPGAVVVRVFSNQSECTRRFEADLARAGYRQRVFVLAKAATQRFFPDGRRSRSIVWNIHTPPPPEGHPAPGVR